MNKLDEYRSKEAKRLYPTSQPRDGKRGIMEISKADYIAGDKQDIYETGFDAAIALELPVKFHIWQQAFKKAEMDRIAKIPVEKRKGEFQGLLALYTEPKELYTYWIENIYKPEL